MGQTTTINGKNVGTALRSKFGKFTAARRPAHVPNIRKDNEAVSAVIGVILMVAITVILAAIIGVFVMNMTGNLPKTPGYAAFSVQRIQSDGIAEGDLTDSLNDGGLIITCNAKNGEPITVIKLLDGDGNPIATAEDLAGLSTMGKPVTLVPSAALPHDAFKMTIVGQTADGAENILQTINVAGVEDADLIADWPTV